VETSKDSVLKEKRDRWHEGLSKDVYVEEALNVLDDLQSKVGFKNQSKMKKKLAKSWDILYMNKTTQSLTIALHKFRNLWGVFRLGLS
jgi:hypothetical protein